MYVCLCNALTDDRIRQAIANGARKPREVYAACNCGAQCGGCTHMILAFLREGTAPATPGAAVQ